LAAFAYRNFRLLWIGAFLSSIGTWTQDVALAWFIHTRYANPLYLGLQNFSSNAPLLAFMVVGGAAADRIDRRSILLTSQILQMLFAATLAVLFAFGRLTIASILVIAFLTGLAQSQSAPTYQAVLTSLVPRERIPNAVALNSLQFNLSRAVGPAIAGLLLASAGTGACLATNAASFIAVIIALWRITIPSPSSSGQSLRDSLRSGFVHVFEHPLLRRLTALAAVSSFLSFPLLTYLPVLSDARFHSGAVGFARLLSAFGAGAILGAIATAQRGHTGGGGRVLLLALSAYGAATVFVTLSHSQILTMVLLFVAGAMIVSAYSTLNSLVQESAPDHIRGRVLSIYGLAFRGGMPLGSLVAGFLVKPFGAPLVIGTFAGLVVLVGVTAYFRDTALRAL
jgi:predicted MFS family arabinose efflux permease